MFFCVRTVNGMPRVWLWCIVALAFVQNIGNIGSVEDSTPVSTIAIVIIIIIYPLPNQWILIDQVHIYKVSGQKCKSVKNVSLSKMITIRCIAFQA